MQPEASAGVLAAIATHVVAFIVWGTRLHVRSEDHDERLEKLERAREADHDAIAAVQGQLGAINAKLDFLIDKVRK